MPEGAEEAILRGMYLLREAREARRAARAAAGLGHDPARGARRRRPARGRLRRRRRRVERRPVFTELRRDGMEAERWNRLHPGEAPRTPYVERVAWTGAPGPVVAATDYMRAFADQIRPFVGGRSLRVLGTDGFGRSDYRAALRRFFEVDRHHVVARRADVRSPRGTIERAVREGDRALRASTPSGQRLPGGHALTEVLVPDIGDFDGRPGRSRSSSPPGDAVADRGPAVTLESDKATMDVPAPFGRRGRGAAA